MNIVRVLDFDSTTKLFWPSCRSQHKEKKILSLKNSGFEVYKEILCRLSVQTIAILVAKFPRKGYYFR